MSKLRKTSDAIEEIDLYDVSKLIIDSFDEYEREYDVSKKESLFELIDSLIDKHKEIEAIYDKLSYAATTHPLDYSSYFDVSEDNPNPDDRTLIEEIMERVHIDSHLRRHDNEVHQILRETIGWYFNELDVIQSLRAFLLKNASGIILEEYAYQYGLQREEGESDTSLRYRILAHMKESYRVPDVEASGIDLFTYVEDPYTQLTSKNTYLSRKYLGHGSDIMMDYWDGRYMTWRDIVWF